VDIALMVEKEDTLRVDRKACVRKTLAATNLITRTDFGKFLWRVLPTVSNFVNTNESIAAPTKNCSSY